MHIPVPKQVREEMEEGEGEKMEKGGKKDTGRRGGQRGEKREINGGRESPSRTVEGGAKGIVPWSPKPA